MLFAVGPAGVAMMASPLVTKPLREALATRRPVGTAPAPARIEDRVEARVCNDRQLADTIEACANKDVASMSRVLICRDTPQHLDAFTVLLNASTVVESNTLSTRVYRVSGAE